MIFKAKDISAEQRTAVEGLLGRPVRDNEEISVQTVNPAQAPKWLRQSWSSAREAGVDSLSVEQIDAEIDAARKVRSIRQPLAP